MSVSHSLKSHLLGCKLTSGGIQSATTSLTLEVLGFLMQGQNLQVIKVTLTIVAPRTSQEFFQGGTASLLSHYDKIIG